ncbi:DinB family protein [Roseibium sp.]|uniref:DinB family protein n=1 Tax=Roseibium sp. TaxID=1936156 RepID=UPI0032675076
MIDPKLYQTMAVYNGWMTDKLYDTCAQVSDDERKADKGAFFKSIHSTLNHILFADRAWMTRFSSKVYEHKGMGVDIYSDFEDLRTAHLVMAGDIEAWASELDPDWLARDLTWISSDGTRTTTRPGWVLVTHMFNHQTHHRGQIGTLLSQMGHDIGVTDLPFMPAFSAD